MRKGGGKAKGSQFERDVCKKLSLWITHGKKEDCFWRSAMSGGRATVGRKQGKDHARHAGDISATSPEGHVLTDNWYVECKSYGDLAITACLLTGRGTLASFWREAVEQATHFKRMPMLIAKQDRQPTFVLLPTAHLLTPYGTAIYPAAHLGRFTQLRADVLDFEGMLKLPFMQRMKDERYPFLKPGEFDKIMKQKRPVFVKRERMPIKRIRL